MNRHQRQFNVDMRRRIKELENINESIHEVTEKPYLLTQKEVKKLNGVMTDIGAIIAVLQLELEAGGAIPDGPGSAGLPEVGPTD